MPLDPKLNKFTTIGATTVNIDFVEFLTGRGIKTLYLADVNCTDTAVPQDGTTLILTPNQIFSDVGTFSSGHNTAMDEDFDMVIEETIQVDGEVIVTLPCLALQNGAGAFQHDITVKIRHWDGSTETDLVSMVSKISRTMAGGAVGQHEIITVKGSVTRTFLKGETLRVSISHGATGNLSAILFGIDPKSRLTGLNVTVTGSSSQGTWINTSASTVALPIRIE